jgi:6-pyruvoyltetrahydropterin/6-carboxytetrahydropterin synthase
MPVTLTRTVRFCVNPVSAGQRSGANGYGGKPAMEGLGRYYELDVRCLGEPDPRTGYLVNIKDIDAAARDAAIPVIERACRERPGTHPATLLPELLPPLNAALGDICSGVTLRLTPTYTISMEKDDMRTVTIRQRFDFAASHRLHTPSLSDEENRRVFGKCNNPSGHGHNYQVEPAVNVTVREGEPPFSLSELEEITDRAIIERFDHKYLNTDTDEFDAAGGVNPSVEHIARVCFELLAPEVERASRGDATLTAVTVWETDRTSSTFAPAPTPAARSAPAASASA